MTSRIACRATDLMVRAGDILERDPTSSAADWLALAPHGQAHSHLDALCHFAYQAKIYNNRPVRMVTSIGAEVNDITIGENGIVSRGVLLDLPLVKGVDWLRPDPRSRWTIWPRLRCTQGVGFSALPHPAGPDPGRHRRRAAHGPWNASERLAGLHYTCAPWLKERGVALLGSDGVSDYRPHDVEGVRNPIHTLTLVAMGMQLLDNQNLEQLAEACASRKRWEFLLMVAPLRLERGTASAVNPIAVF